MSILSLFFFFMKELSYPNRSFRRKDSDDWLVVVGRRHIDQESKSVTAEHSIVDIQLNAKHKRKNKKHTLL